MTTLAAFLLARIAEDEARAQGVLDRSGRPWQAPTREFQVDYRLSVDDYSDNEFVQLIADPGWVLAECEAKRQIVETCQFERTLLDAHPSETQRARCQLAEDVARTLALPYADHPDFREEWKP